MRTLSVTAGLALLAVALVLGVACLLSGPPNAGAAPADKPDEKGQPAAGQGWGDVKGQIVYAGNNLPQRAKVDVNKDQAHCLSKGPILSDTWVVNPKNKGVRWAVVWLTDENNVRLPGKIPVNPDLAKPKNATASVDQPCCVYEPHVLAMRSDQQLVFKNSGAVPHNVKFEGGTYNPSGNPIINPGAEYKVEEPVKYAWVPINVECNIHPWMKAYVRVFDHPYFAVTDEDGNFEIKDAPAGTWFLNVWQEEVGIVGAKTMKVNGQNVTMAGQKVTVKAGGPTTVEPIAIKAEK